MHEPLKISQLINGSINFSKVIFFKEMNKGNAVKAGQNNMKECNSDFKNYVYN